MKKLLLPLAVLLLASCSKPDVGLDAVPPSESTVENYSVNITRKQAEKRALEAMSQFLPSSTRSVARRVKSSDLVIDHTATKSESDQVGLDTLFYVVNFENDEGYVVLAADSRTVDVLVIAEEGNLDWQNPNNSTQKFINNSLANYQRSAIGNINDGFGGGNSGIKPPIKDIADGPKNILPTITFKYEPWVKNTANTILPMLKTYWSQGAPYNDRMPLIWLGGGTRNYVGCTAIAIAQVMAYHKQPKEFYGRFYDWNAMYQDEPNDDIITFITMIHNAFPPLSVFYGGNEGTVIHPANIKTVLEKMGYKYGDYLPGYDYAAILRSLKSGSPTTFTGFELNTEASMAHTWVIDGHLEFSRNYAKHISPCVINGVAKRSETIYGTDRTRYFHYNLGWGHYVNKEYYYEGVFDTDRGFSDSVKDASGQRQSPMQKSNGSNDYKNLIKMWVNIKP